MKTIVSAVCLGVLAGTPCFLIGCGDDGGHDPPQLSSTTHPGWLRADCASCHDVPNQHGGKYQVTDCMGCHGPNGQPFYPSGHSASGCTNCHSQGSAPWNAATHFDYSADADCLACHDL